jgi:NADPH-dependent ferric siderophore reductase
LPTCTTTAPDSLTDTGTASFEVVTVTQLSARRLLISLAAETPWECHYAAGQDLLLVVAKDGDRAVHGRYTVRRFDPYRRHLDIEAVLELDGPAARWAASVVPGEPVSSTGPCADFEAAHRVGADPVPNGCPR